MSGAERPSYDASPEHEAKCRRCGMSCHFAIEVGGERLIIPEIHCFYLARDGAKARCTVYERRFDVAPWCHEAAEAAKVGLLGQGCPYAANPADGKRWADPRQRAAILPHVRRALIDKGLERKMNPDAALSVLTAGGERWRWRSEGERYVFERLEGTAP